MDDASGRKRKCDTQLDNVFLYYKGGKVAEGMKSQITRVRIGPQVKDIPHNAFRGCTNLTEVQFGEGSLEVIGDGAFYECRALQQVILPSSVTDLGACAFYGCINLAAVKLNEGLEIIEMSTFHGCRALQRVTIPLSVTKLDNYAFWGCCDLVKVQFSEGLEIIGQAAFNECLALRSVTVPSSVTRLGSFAFIGCINLTEFILLGGERLLNQESLDRGLLGVERALNKKKLSEMIGNGNSLSDDCPLRTDAFHRCPLTTLKISIPRALSERMERLPRECRLSIEQRVHDLRRVELTQDGNILACFPLPRRSSVLDTVEDTNDETAESLHQVLQLILFMNSGSRAF
ncbi:hypothetical protein THAOC_32107 [Thalassiosira oceanica]|uniref:Uncharacterized protein n=1 Tax=Thalassiosira oceanica TaxID=159749 RepID=K0RQQ9_THAOC|nr:hypothetical protein THAOC_32107 [Thalassiosira oceanica]|eukprot:EJK49052.1 hypothetical protein THAOC_32107 [Thalassiosira oceanica]